MICTLILSSSHAFKVISSGKILAANDDFVPFVVLLTFVGFLSGLGFASIAYALVVVVVVFALICAMLGRYSQRLGFGHYRSDARRESARDMTISFAAALFLAGWQSLGFFAASLFLAVYLQRCHWVLLARVSSTAVIGLGFALSFWAGRSMEGQYWLSADQLFRTTIASGLSTWGYSDFSGAVGTTLNYQWLGEAAAGAIARLAFASAAEGLSIIGPALGLLASMFTLRKIATQFGFEQNVALGGSVCTIVLCKEFEVFSPGSLWGLSLFLISVSVVNQIVADADSGRETWGLSTVLMIVTPLVTLSQSTLGLLLLLLTASVGGYQIHRRNRVSLQFVTVFVVQTASTLCLRSTLLADSLNVVYTPTFSLSNVMQFRGLDLYNGNSTLLSAAVSVLFLMLLTQTGAGLLLLERRHLRNPAFCVTITATAVSALILANGISIGGSESQQSRFLSPLVVLMTLVSFLLVIQELTRIRMRRDASLLHWWRSLPIIVAFSLLTIFGVWIHNEEWSPKRSLGVALIVVFGQVLLVSLWTARRTYSKKYRARPFAVALLLLTLIMLSHTRNIANLVEVHETARNSARKTEFVGDLGTRDCLAEIRRVTSRDTIIATNWFRTPPPARRPKYFLVSAWTERRVFLDGPEYIRNTTGGLNKSLTNDLSWLDDRYQATDNFAERASKDAYDLLRAANVEYFVFETYMPAPPTWAPYADVIFERDSCKVLKLRT